MSDIILDSDDLRDSKGAAMKLKSLVSILICFVLVTAILAGCGNSEKPQGENEGGSKAAAVESASVEEASAEKTEVAEASAETAAAEAAEVAEASAETTAVEAAGVETTDVVDVLGRTVSIPSELQTVACPGLPSTRMVVYAGGIDKIAGVTENEKMEMVCAPCADVFHDKFISLPSIGSGWPNSEIYQEELIVLDPDAVILFTNDPAQADELQQQTGIPVLAVFATDFVDQDFRASMDFLGDVFGTRAHTDQLTAYVDSCIEDLDTRTKNIPEEEKPSVYYGAVSFRGYNGIDATYAHYNPFEVIHARNVADETGGNGAMTVEKEQVADWDPDILFLNQEPPTIGILTSDFETNEDFYRGLTAVKNGKVYGQAAYNCVYTNIELSLANAYYAGTVIYPSQFEDIDFEEKAAEILTMFEGEKGPDFIRMMENAGLGWHQITIFE